MNFLRNFSASLLALVVFSVAVVLFFSMIASVFGSKDAVEVKDNSVLHLRIDRPIIEFEFEDPLAGLPINISGNGIGIVQLKQALNNAKEDEDIKGILLETPMIFTAGFSSIEEIRAAIEDFKSSGKFVIAYSEYYSEAAYYLSSIADEVCMHPEGDIEFNGLSAEIMFFKGLFDKLDIKPQVFRVGDYKSAVEPFLRTDMSAENEHQMKALLENIYTNILSRIAEARGIKQDQLREISNKMLVRDPQGARKNGLIDHLFYFDQVNDLVREKLELEQEDEINYITYNKYKKSFSKFKSSENEIAVIVANGEIRSGEGDNNTIGDEKFSRVIRDARRNDDIKAIVLRINSPGGSFVASDVMWREIKLASEVKPVIASMSDLAASGGYYMAMACDTIVAMPNTITGSIGIFGIILDASGFFNEKLGITFDEVKTGEISNPYTFTRSLTDREKSIIQSDVEAGYETFLKKAAEGRNMTVEQVREVASGRIWTGDQAYERNLVDIMGDLDLAVKIAAEKANITDDHKIRYYPKPKTILEQLLQDMEARVKTHYLKEELGKEYIYYEKVKQVLNQQGVMSRIDFDLIVR
jgi:protease-4